MTPKKRKWLLIVFVLIPSALVLSLALPLAFQMLQPLPPLPPLPDPNGYADLVKAGAMVAADTGDFEKLTPAELQKLAADNSAAVTLAQTGLIKKCRVTTQFTKNYLAITNHFVELSALKSVAQALVAAGKNAEQQNHFGEAAKFYLSAVDLGNEAARGGILIDQLVGSATEALGVRALEKITNLLDVSASRETAATLEKLDAQRQTWSDVVQQETAWSRRAFPGVGDRFRAMMTANSMKKVFDQAAKKFASQQLVTRQVMAAFAAHAYELDQGRKPVSFADLVPNYLKTIPQDPTSGTNIMFQP